jgi:circadian clock protein KaiB
MIHDYRLTLYVTGQTVRSERAVGAVRALHETLAGTGSTGALTIVDVLEHSDVADRQRILATPTLVRESPPPARRIIGDLSDRPRVLASLGLAD